MGAFAIENMRTSLERRSGHVSILCRRRGTICPQIVDWVNFIRPYDDEFKHDAAGDAVVLSHWHRVYDISGAHRPECWSEGLLKPDGHTVSVSDLFYIAHALERLSTLCGEVRRLDGTSIHTRAGGVLEATVLIKCVGFELNEGNEKLLGRARMHPTSVAARNLWLQIETHFDSRTFNSPFGSSYLNATSFNAKVMLRSWQDARLRDRLHRSELCPVRINTFSASEGMYGLENADVCVSTLLKTHLEATASAFNNTMGLSAYVDWNAKQWRLLHAGLNGTAQALGSREVQAFPYPFQQLLKDLQFELPELDGTLLVPIENEVIAPELDERGWLQLSSFDDPEDRLQHVADAVQEVVRSCIASDTVSIDAALIEVGFDSLAAVEMTTQLRAASGLADLTPTVLLGPGVTIRSVAYDILAQVDDIATLDPIAASEGADSVLDSILGTVAHGAAPPSPVLAGRILIVLSGCSGMSADVLRSSLQTSACLAPYELHLLPFATMAERRAHLTACNYVHFGGSDPLWTAVAELRGCSKDEARRFLEEDAGNDTWQVYQVLIAIAHPRILVDVTPSNSAHVSFAQRALRMFERPSFLWLVRHPMACVESAIVQARSNPSRSPGLDADLEHCTQIDWVEANATIDAFVSDLANDASTTCEIATIRYEELTQSTACVDSIVHGRCNVSSTDPNVVIAASSEESASVDGQSSSTPSEDGPASSLSSVKSVPTMAVAMGHNSDSDHSVLGGDALRPGLRMIRACPLHNMQSATKLMARKLEYDLAPDLPIGCCWMGMPPLTTTGSGSGPAMTTIVFPGIVGGPTLFEELAPHLAADEGGALVGTIALSYTMAMTQGCSVWTDFIVRCAESIRQFVRRRVRPSSGHCAGPLRLVGYSFGCRIAYAVTRILSKDQEIQSHGQQLSLYLLDGPIGGPCGPLEKAMLELGDTPMVGAANANLHYTGAGRSARRRNTMSRGNVPTDELSVARQLVSLLTRGGERSPELLGTIARVELFVASEDQVGADVLVEYLPHVPVHMLAGRHRALLSGSSACRIGELISFARARDGH